MTTQRNLFKVMVMAAVVSTGFLTARSASACNNDIDCTTNPACGGDICDWTKGMTCGPAGLSQKGMDGWCSVDSDCKCFAQGARCGTNFYCTFTLPSQAPGGGASGGASGSSGGTTGRTGGASGSTGGATGSGGASSDAGTKAADSGGGCAVAGTGASYSWLAALGGLAAVLAARRRRRI